MRSSWPRSGASPTRSRESPTVWTPTAATDAAQFEADREDRRTQLDAVEYLLREMAIGVGGATAEPPIVVGGSIEPGARGAERAHGSPDVDLDLSETLLGEDSQREVR